MIRDVQNRAACLHEISWTNKFCRGRTKMEKCPWGGRYFKHRPPLGSIVPALAGANLTPPIEISTKKSRKTSVGVGFRRPIIVVPNYNSMVKSVRQRPCKLSAASRPSGRTGPRARVWPVCGGALPRRPRRVLSGPSAAGQKWARRQILRLGLKHSKKQSFSNFRSTSL